MDCKKCDLYKTRKNIVQGKGSIPAQVLFIGEAPGFAENVKGEPFAGKNGLILRAAIKATGVITRRDPPEFYLTNAVRCLPVDEEGNKREPSGDEILACSGALEETFLKVQPEKIIFLGDVSFRFLKKVFPSGQKVFHPGYVGKKGGTEATEFRTLVRDLAEIFKELKK